MTMWIGEVFTVAFLLRQLSVFLDNEDIILVLTIGLLSSYNMFIVVLDTTEPSQLTLDYVIRHLLNEESHLITSTPTNTTSDGNSAPKFATTAQVNHGRRLLDQITCYSCGCQGHYQSYCPNH